MTSLPPELLAARTPAEWKRHQMIDRLWAGMLISFVGLFMLVLVVWLGDWSAAVERQRLSILGWVAAAFVAYEMVGALANSVGGPVGRWKARWGDRELDVSAKVDELKAAVAAVPEAVADKVYDGGALPAGDLR